MSADQLVKVAKEILKPHERKGTVGSAAVNGALGGGMALGAYKAGTKIGMIGHTPIKFNKEGAKALAASAKTIGRVGLKGAALGGAIGLGYGGVRAAYRGLRGHTSVSPKEYEYRKNNQGD